MGTQNAPDVGGGVGQRHGTALPRYKSRANAFGVEAEIISAGEANERSGGTAPAAAPRCRCPSQTRSDEAQCGPTLRLVGRLGGNIRTDDLKGALWLPMDGSADPTMLTNSFAKGAKNRGVSHRRTAAPPPLSARDEPAATVSDSRCRGERRAALSDLRCGR